MNRLNIQQSSNVEIVGADLILKLYETALTTSDITLVGNLQCEHCKESAYNYLTGTESGVRRFPDLLINVTGGVYIEFADPEVERVLMEHNVGDGTGISASNMNSLTSIPYGWFGDNTTITLFPELGRFNNITTIGLWAFSGCSNLTTIDLTNIQNIGGQAFQGTGLTGVINLPNIITLGDSARGGSFSACSGITLCNIGPNFDSTSTYYYDLFLGCSNLSSVTGLGNITVARYGMFNGCSSLSSVDIDFSKITIVGSSTFETCENLQINAALLSNVREFGNRAFLWCSKLTGIVNCPNLSTMGSSVFKYTGISSVSNLGSVTYIGEECFNGCTSLTSVVLPGTITRLYGNAFRGCTNLLHINIPSTCTTLDGDCLHDCTNLDETFDLSNVTSIGANCFNGCSKVKISNFPRVSSYGVGLFKRSGIVSALIPKEVTTIKGECFQECTSLQTVSFESGSQLTALEYNAFCACGNLQSITLPEGLTNIPSSCFLGCDKLYTMDIPSTVTTISNRAFNGIGSYNNYTNATTVIFRSTNVPTFLGDDNLFGRDNTTKKQTLFIYVPDASLAAYKAAANLSYFSDRIFGISEL